MSDVTIFAPSPTLTVTVEDHPQGSDIHVHAGGQGVWQARMLRRLGVSVTMCCVLSGEIGRTLKHLLEDEGITVVAIEREGRGSAYLHDRRQGKRVVIVEEDGDPIDRHARDDLYGAVLHSGAESKAVLLSGPAGVDTVPADIYRRLAIDLRDEECTVIADLAGERLQAVVDGGVDVLKVSHAELLDDGLVKETSVPEMTRAMRRLQEQGAGSVIVTRSSEPLLLLDEHGVIEVSLRRFEENETRGAGDSLTAGVVAAITRGEGLRQAITLGAAAGALNVTRHGLGTGDGDAIARLRERVEVRESPANDVDAAMPQGRISPEGLAALAETEGIMTHRVLITNDDGIDAPGLVALADAAVKAGFDVTVAAPAAQSSGSSASIMATESDGRIAVEKRTSDALPDVRMFAVHGGPGLIAMIAARGAFGSPPDVVLSGVNHGANVGRAILHSGTVGAALTGALNGAWAMAVSLDVGMKPDEFHWDAAASAAVGLVPALTGQPRGTTMNVNVPNLADSRGIRQCTLAPFGIVQTTVAESDESYVRLAVEELPNIPTDDSDAACLAQGWITVTGVESITEHPMDIETDQLIGGTVDSSAVAGASPVSVGSGTR